MSWRERLEPALDRGEPGSVTVEAPHGAHAEVEVYRADAIGVRLGRVRLHRPEPRDVAAEAERLAEQVRALPDRLAPVEVAPALGGAVLRSRPEEMRDREYYEVRVEGAHDVEVRKVRVTDDGSRTDATWDVTREQLGRLLDELEG